MTKFSERVYALVKKFEPHRDDFRFHQAYAEMIMQEVDRLEERIEGLEAANVDCVNSRF